MRISRSRYETFMDCPYKYYLTFIVGLAPRIMAEPLRKGRAAHQFLNAWYDNSELALEERLQLAHEKLQAAIDETAPKIMMEGITNNEAKLEAESHALMDAYVKAYGAHDADITVIASEVAGNIDLPGGHVLCFEADQIVSYRDELWLMENKTTAQLGPSFLKKFMLNHQLTVYSWGAAKIVGRFISGTFLNAMRKPHPSAQLPTPEFYRTTFVITQRHIKKALSSFIHAANDIESRDRENEADWPQDTNRCHDYGGCPFWQHCAHASPAEVGPLFARRGEDYVDNPNVKGYPPPILED
jgi:hypothetical protein